MTEIFPECKYPYQHCRKQNDACHDICRQYGGVDCDSQKIDFVDFVKHAVAHGFFDAFGMFGGIQL